MGTRCPATKALISRGGVMIITPNLYIRVGNAPTVNHFAGGSCDWWDGQLIDRQLTSGTTEYGNWVPLKGRYQSQLTPGLWVLAVQAAGNANARYRLQVSCGNSITNGVVQDMALVGGSFTNQNLDGGNWRYYRVQIPDPAPANWVVNFTRTLGGAIMFVRDSSPPGDGNTTSPLNYANPNYNPGQASTDLQTWNSDDKNEGPYPRFDTPGTFNLTRRSAPVTFIISASGLPSIPRFPSTPKQTAAQFKSPIRLPSSADRLPQIFPGTEPSNIG